MNFAKMTLGVIVGNRDFFPDVLISEGRRDMLDVLAEMGIDVVILDEDATKLGAVETWQHAKLCAELFRQHADKIDGILVTLPNFGDEKGVADTIRLAGLNVPVLVQAYPDDIDRMFIERRRDAFCGKISVCNNLYQYGIPFSLTRLHTVNPKTESFKRDLADFLGVCRVVKHMRGARFGAIGARPNAFNTTRYSEKLMQAFGMSVSTIDLSEIFGRANKLEDKDARVNETLERIGAYVRTDKVPAPAVVKQAKLAVVIDEWMTSLDLTASAIQCWTSLQQNYGVSVCTIMSMMSESMMPSACEVDVTGVASMYALQLARLTPAALVDWNNNYGDDPDKCVLFHCGNWAKSFLGPNAFMSDQKIIGSTVGIENTYGTLEGVTPAGPFSYARITTDDRNGQIKAYIGDGEFLDDPIKTFGTNAVVRVPRLQALMQHVCRNGFEHHAAMTNAYSASVLNEAFTTYFGWETLLHA
ncbi:MAG: L-fucose/L-arabinose isomerase family protein [Pleurocapsa minor GSE-CHR-MK-17-07R]|jgi:L-fucose isomerase-like protein|nr:L-fucose/L-arabinose isomerase family protein [Pleurocapsa minor GSE-CHR-MK 17-07R]